MDTTAKFMFYVYVNSNLIWKLRSRKSICTIPRKNLYCREPIFQHLIVFHHLAALTWLNASSESAERPSIGAGTPVAIFLPANFSIAHCFRWFGPCIIGKYTYKLPEK